MSLDDPRLEWIRDRVYCGFGLTDPGCFEDLLTRNNGEHEEKLLRFLNETSAEEEGASALFFFKSITEEDVEVHIAIEPEETLNVNNVPQEEDANEALSGNEIEEQSNSDHTSSLDPSSDSNDNPAVSDNGPPAPEVDGKAEVTTEHGSESIHERTDETAVTPITLTKTIKQKVYCTVLYVSFNCIPEEFADLNALFFLRNTQETILEPNDIHEARDVMPMFLEYGFLNGHPLLMLKQVFSQVFMPLFSYNQHKTSNDPVQEDQSHLPESSDDSIRLEQPAVELRSAQPIRDEFLMNMQKFLNHIQQTIQQLEGEIKLEMPDVNLDDEPNRLASDKVAVEKLEQCVMNWQTQMSAALEELLLKKPQGNGPLAEVDFWRERNATLSALSEQLKLPSVKKVLNVLSITDPGLVQNLDLTVTELAKYHVEAADNVRFLTTLERHLKNLTHGTSFNVVLDTIPSMMNALRLVWIISRHYNKDDRMVPLMERIAWEIAERVCRVLNIHTLFRENRETAKNKTMEAKQTLELWKSCYFEVRAKIEASGRDQRWEFDRKRLFEKTDYLTTICQDLFNILQVLEEFYNIFGPELKAVTGDPKRIDDVLNRVDGLIKPMETLSFDPFNIKYGHQWKLVMDDFKNEVHAIEGEAINFIDESFKTLRSAEAAFDMLLKFKHIRSRDAINRQMMMKFNAILEQYCKEVDIVNNIFVENLNNPPLYKNHPPVAGSIYWERSLFNRIKRTIIRFLEMEEMLSCEHGKMAKAKYLDVARRMKAYEDKKYESWKESTDQILPSLLKRNLLVNTKIPNVVNPAEPEVDQLKSDTDYRNIHYAVNFAPELQEIIMETKHMEQLGFSVGELQRNVALQDDKFLRLSGLAEVVVDSCMNAFFYTKC